MTMQSRFLFAETVRPHILWRACEQPPTEISSSKSNFRFGKDLRSLVTPQEDAKTDRQTHRQTDRQRGEKEICSRKNRRAKGRNTCVYLTIAYKDRGTSIHEPVEESFWKQPTVVGDLEAINLLLFILHKTTWHSFKKKGAWNTTERWK